MKKPSAYITLLICLLIYVVSSSDRLTRNFKTYKEKNNALIKSDKMRFGDLYGFANLRQYKVSLNDDGRVKKIKYDRPNTIDLYSLCDSYLWAFGKSDTLFSGVNEFKFATVDNLETISLSKDSTKNKILLIEFVERHLRMMVETHFDYMKTFIKPENDFNANGSSNFFVNKIRSIPSFLFNKNINSNIELNVWESSIFTPVKELKAQLNYKLFNKVNKDVVISPDKKYLLFFPTIDTTSIYSSFQFIPDIEIDTIINRLNQVYYQYKKMGFDEIYLSVIPNPVSVLYPHINNYNYNNLISRIENNNKLQMPFIDVSSDLKNAQFPVYQISDTHWNYNGFNLWLNKVNDVLNRY